MKKITIMIVDDHALVRDGIKALLENVDDIELVGEAEDGHEAVKNAGYYAPDLVLMDIQLPDTDGIEAAKSIKKLNPAIKVLFLSMEINEELISETIKAGGAGYIPKDIRRDELIKAIREVDATGKYFSASITELVFNQFFQKNSDKPDKTDNVKKNLSNRETEVLKLLASGVNKRNIADKLFISVRTVDAHRNNIMGKLNFANTAEMVKFAIKNDLIAIDN